MKIDNLEQYINVREALIKEKAELEERLSRIHQALGEPARAGQPSPSTQLPASSSSGAGPRRGRPPVSGGQSLREVVAGVLTNSGPLTKHEVLEKVLRTGYKFTTTNPLNSLGVILYGKGNGFIRENGRFSLQGGRSSAAPAPASQPSSSGGPGRGPRKMSEEAKARIAAAARLRWKKAKAEGKTHL